MLEQQVAEQAGKEFVDDQKFPVSFRRGNPFATEQEAIINLSDLKGSLSEDVEVQQDLPPMFRNEVHAALSDLEGRGNNPFLLNNLGTAYLKAGKIHDAEEAFRKAVAEDPYLLSANTNLATIYARTNRLDEAIGLYERLLRSNSQNVTLVLNLAQLYIQKGVFQRAETLLDTAILENQSNADSYNNRGILKLLKGHVNEALSDFRKALKLSIRSATFHNNVGVCYILLKSPKKSLREFKAALTLNPLDEHAVKNFARVCLAEGLIDGSIPVLQKFLSYRGEDIEGRELLAKAYFKLAKYSQALDQLIPALKIAENHGLKKPIPRTLNNLGVVWGALGDTERAEGAFRNCLEIDPYSRIALNNLASLLLREARPLDASQLLTQSITRLGEDAVTLTLLGECFSLGEQYDQTVEFYRKAITCDPKYSLSYALLSTTLIEAYSQYDAAIKTCQLGLRHKPNEPLLLNNLAYAYLMAGDIAKARSILDRIPNEHFNIYLTATRGLLLLKEGDLLEASRLYNSAAAMAKNRELRGLVIQKKNLEFARHAAKEGNEAKASRLLTQALKIRTNNKIYAQQAARLRNQLSDQQIK